MTRRALLDGRIGPTVAGLAVGLIAFGWLAHVNPVSSMAYDDEIRDRLLVRDCIELGFCHGIGASASLAGIHQGAVWLDVQTAVRWLGGDGFDERWLVLALLALGVATAFVVTWNWLGASLALPTALLLVVELSLEAAPNHPPLSAFPDVLTAAALLCHALSGRRGFLIVSGLMLGLAVNVHVGSLILLPSLTAVALLSRPRPWSGLIAALTGFFLVCITTSAAALRANVIGIARYGIILPAAAAGLVLVTALVSGRRFRNLPHGTRAWLTGLVLVMPFGAASTWLIISQRHHFSLDYLHPILTAVAALGAGLVSIPFEIAGRRYAAVRWLPTAAAVAAIGGAAIKISAPPIVLASSEESWTPPEAAILAPAIASRGWNYEDLVFRLQSPHCRELLMDLSVHAPAPGEPLHDGELQLQVLKASTGRAATAGARDAVVLDEHDVAIVREIRSWLRPESLTACRYAIDSAPPSVCAMAPISPAILPPERFLFMSRAFPEIHLESPRPYVSTYEIGVSPVAGVDRDLILAEDGTSPCAWRITRLDGLHTEEPLPARRVRMRSDDGGPGRLVVAKRFGDGICEDDDAGYPPCMFESEPGDPLQALLAVN